MKKNTLRNKAEMEFLNTFKDNSSKNSIYENSIKDDLS
jgi:hypothetical protein